MPWPMNRVLAGRPAVPVAELMPDQTTVYRLYDQRGRLLYVGVTEVLVVRLTEHRRTKEWWNEVAWVTSEPFWDRYRALDAEVAAILEERPRYNGGKRLAFTTAELLGEVNALLAKVDAKQPRAAPADT